jgi:hypothetical protein
VVISLLTMLGISPTLPIQEKMSFVLIIVFYDTTYGTYELQRLYYTQGDAFAKHFHSVYNDHCSMDFPPLSLSSEF